MQSKFSVVTIQNEVTRRCQGFLKLSRPRALRRWAISNQNIIMFGLRREEFFTSNLNVSVIKRDKSEIGFPCLLSEIKWKMTRTLTNPSRSSKLCFARVVQKSMLTETHGFRESEGIHGDMRILSSVFVCTHIKECNKNWRPLQIWKVGRRKKSTWDKCSNKFRNIGNLREASVFSSAVKGQRRWHHCLLRRTVFFRFWSVPCQLDLREAEPRKPSLWFYQQTEHLPSLHLKQWLRSSKFERWREVTNDNNVPFLMLKCQIYRFRIKVHSVWF